MPSNRKIIVGIGALLALLATIMREGTGVLALAQSAHAADSLVEIQNMMIQWLGYVFDFSHFLIYLCLALISALMDPGVINLSTNADAPTMGDTLLAIWQISRNLTNILLAFLLIVGAVMTIVFAKSEYASKYAVKFILAIVLVNFSWFFPRVVLDLANVLTATVYSLPSEINIECHAINIDGTRSDDPCKIITDFEFFADDAFLKKAGNEKFECKIPMGGECVVAVKEEDMATNANAPNIIMGGLVYNHARLRTLGQVMAPPMSDVNASPTFGRLPQLMIFLLLFGLSTFFSLALLFPLAALTVILLIRIPVIWITVAFMPFMFLGYVAGDTAVFKAFNPMEIWKKFVSAAFIPTLLAVPIAVGFIMLNVAMEHPPAVWQLDHPVLRLQRIPLIPSVANIWQLVWVGMSIAVVWVGTRAAMKVDPFLEKFGKPLMDAGASMGRLLVKLPLLVPLPLPGGVSMNLGQAMNIAKAPEQLVAHKFNVPNLFGGAGGNGPVVDSTRATTILETRLKMDSAANIQHLTNIESALDRLARATTPDDQKRETHNLRLTVNAAMGNEGSIGHADDLKNVIAQLRNKDLAGKRRIRTAVPDANFRD